MKKGPSDSIYNVYGEYYAFLNQMDSMNLTVLEAELNSGDFRLIYNSNPDYTVKMPEAAFEKFAQFFGNSQIHPDDQERYMQEIEYCHGPFFEQNLRRHSVFSRMFRPTTGEYQLHEFITLRLETEAEDEKKVILLCRPIKKERPDADIWSDELLESEVLYDVLGRTLRCRWDETLTIVGGTSSIQNLTDYTAKDVNEKFEGCLTKLICPEDRDRVMQELDEHLSYGNTAEVEFRISTKNAEDIWVIGCCHQVSGEQDGKYLYCFLVESTQVREELEKELQRLKKQVQKNETIFQIVSNHSDHILYEYDVLTGRTCLWGKGDRKQDILAHLYKDSYQQDNVEKNQGILEESFADVKKFFSDIHGGVPSGEAKLHIRLENGQPRWYHFRYTNIFDRGKPVTALISVEDITSRHEQELVYQRYLQLLADDADKEILCIESNLTEDVVEKISGRLLKLLPEDLHEINCVYSKLGDVLQGVGFQSEGENDVFEKLSLTNLKEAYETGERRLQMECQVYFNDGSLHWLETVTTLITDPYNGHLKVAIRVMDGTEAYEEQQQLVQRADYDAMTGLLQRDVGEKMIQKNLANKGTVGGILLVLDLDDLKGINDTLGHLYGDRALMSTSNVLKKHFRKDDIKARFGGDEFVVFLPEAGKSVAAVEKSLVTLLRKLSAITVGDDVEQSIHCSIGCAVEVPGEDTFESLMQRADTALYHVKRSSRNNYAFYTPEMEQADYVFRYKKLLSVPNDQTFAMNQLQAFLDSMILFYQLILSVNLGENTYYLMEEVEEGVFSSTPAVGILNDFVGVAGERVHPDDKAEYFRHLSREGLLHAYQEGRKTIHHHFRFLNENNYHWVECVVVFYLNEQGDLCDFTMLRWADDKAETLERGNCIDKLTGLYNRNQYSWSILELGIKPPGSLGVIALDINGFQEINDTYGLEYGDHVLKRISEIIDRHFPQKAYRIAGDEFIVLCDDISKEEFKQQIVELQDTFDVESICEVAMGFAWNDTVGNVDVNVLCQQAQEMRRAEKQSYYHTVLNEGQSTYQISLASEVLREIENERFVVYYQPQIDLKTGAVVGAEALVRKIADDGSQIPPSTFISFYEVSGIISYVDLYVLRTACNTLRSWREQGYDLRISVNLSRVTLLASDIVDAICKVCAEAGVPTTSITIEVTESISKMDKERFHKLMNDLKAVGFSVSLDDFGSKYSNLAILSDMDFDEVKFDRSLISTLEANRKSRLVIESGLWLCHSIGGTSSLAEGIETKGQLELLMDYQCDYGQGYYFSPPMPLEEFDTFLREHRQ